ncbi:MAG: ABC transporter substrate-binding protein, partial [Clostridia bacterium]|nr:ABC transporter substrate-binding protein [Clostridia bacterium]
MAIVLLVAFTVTGCSSGSGPQPAAEENVVRIAVAGPMAFIHGEHHWYGAEMAAEEINGAGGIKVGDKNYKIELIKVDTNELLSVSDAATAVERAITEQKADFLTGSIRTEAALAMQDVAMDYKKIFLVAGASHVGLAEKVAEDYDRYKYWFRVSPINANLLAKTPLILVQDVAAKIRQELNIETPKVAIVFEKAQAGDVLAEVAQQVLPTMGMEVVGVWRPSPTATDLTAELTAIKDSGAHIIYTYFSAAAGVPYAKQWGELQIPAASVGINVEAQAQGFMEATDGKGNYEYTLNTYAPVEITEKTLPFYEKFVEKNGQFPTYNAGGTYDSIYLLKEAIERAGTLDADAIVAELEKTDTHTTGGRFVFDENHDVIWGPGYVTAVGTQWQDGELVCVWPNGREGGTYPG